MLKVTINEKQTIEVENSAEGLVLNGQHFDWDIVPVGDNQYHILYNNRSYSAEILEANRAEKTFKIKLNGKLYDIAAKDRFDLLLDRMGINNTAKNKVNNIKAPMPGLIWEIKVAVGDVVKAGDIMLVLVAMKMENALKSAGDGVVKTILINTGDTVEKGQILIAFE
jgi:biotin carboxyl carrier protein